MKENIDNWFSYEETSIFHQKDQLQNTDEFTWLTFLFTWIEILPVDFVPQFNDISDKISRRLLWSNHFLKPSIIRCHFHPVIEFWVATVVIVSNKQIRALGEIRGQDSPTRKKKSSQHTVYVRVCECAKLCIYCLRERESEWVDKRQAGENNIL